MISIEVENLIRFKKINQIKRLYANVLFLWNDTLLKIRNYFIIIILLFVYSCENSGSGDFQADSLPISFRVHLVKMQVLLLARLIFIN